MLMGLWKYRLLTLRASKPIRRYRKNNSLKRVLILIILGAFVTLLALLTLLPSSKTPGAPQVLPGTPEPTAQTGLEQEVPSPTPAPTPSPSASASLAVAPAEGEGVGAGVGEGTTCPRPVFDVGSGVPGCTFGAPGLLL